MVTIDINDIGKSKKEVLTDLLYETNDMRIPLTKVVYGDPVALDPRPDIKTDHNTMIPITVAPEWSLAYDGAGLLYRRVDIADYMGEQVVEDVEFHTTSFPVPLCDLLPQINAQLEYPIDCQDVLSYQITHSGLQDVTIAMNPKSLLWMGQVVIPVTIVNDNLLPLYTVVAARGFDVYGDGDFTGLPNE